jgi:hypothetical protein
MQLITPNYGNMLWITSRMRKMDREEIYATRWSDDPKSLAADALTFTEMTWIAADDNEPVAAGGAMPLHPGVWSMWMFATDKWMNVALGATRHAKRVLIPNLRNTGAHRLECKSNASHLVAHKWLEMLGAKKESEVKEYGRQRENFFLYSWNF